MIICPTISQMGNQDTKKSSDLFKVTPGFCNKTGELETWTRLWKEPQREFPHWVNRDSTDLDIYRYVIL